MTVIMVPRGSSARTFASAGVAVRFPRGTACTVASCMRASQAARRRTAVPAISGAAAATIAAAAGEMPSASTRSGRRTERNASTTTRSVHEGVSEDNASKAADTRACPSAECVPHLCA